MKRISEVSLFVVIGCLFSFSEIDFEASNFWSECLFWFFRFLYRYGGVYGNFVWNDIISEGEKSYRL